ncbi:Thiol-disulfide isomerase or thioredoxin [Persephonella hydrogeniphila]|uniref:Thiol-disulfide isomerase or thioredoxin n=1 Tax=Persephonella hydrogeniphila TaxID=198703 RepID=A0A285NJ96_9AQUI|nr:TlpA disulfide reductase family protein [Persephonella hydrogeniphila]SNZ07936.1 Thiol-disulfide isomerase or thioredoxin [Persephonella hydrogeniphila]
MKNIIVSITTAILFFSFMSYGKKAPDVYFEDLNGKKVYVEDFKGKPTVLVFWQLYCHSCKKELPEISKLAKEYEGKVRFYAVVIGTRDILQIEEKKREWGFDLPVLIAGYKAKSAFGIFGTPITVVIDKNLDIKGKIIGSRRTFRLKEILDKVVQE